MNKAYTKIDNLCCLNANKYGKDFFKDYEENKDEDLCKDVYEMIDCLEEIKEDLLKKEKLEKAFEIIKNKGVFVAYLMRCDSLEDYNSSIFNFKSEHPLKQEEFNLLREVLK